MQVKINILELKTPEKYKIKKVTEVERVRIYNHSRYCARARGGFLRQNVKANPVFVYESKVKDAF